MMIRRSANLILIAICLVGAIEAEAAPEAPIPPVRAITSGPKFHWFGYYDKLQFDPTGRYVLSMQVDFEHRSPRADDVIKIGMVDLQRSDKWIELGTSRAWGWQQGCMLQWIPGTKSTILWNDRQGDRFVCHIMDVLTRKKRTIPYAIYTVTPDGRFGASVDFRRIQDMRPGYGYAGLPDPNKSDMAPKNSGIWLVDLATGKGKLIVTLAEVAKIPFTGRNVTGAKHYFNHLLFNTDGTRLEFLHRYRPNGGRGGFITRMLTCGLDGSDVRIVDPSGSTSHFIWRGTNKILAWSRYKKVSGFFLYEDKPGGGRVVQVGKGVMTANGHCTYLPDDKWILNDTYPQGRNRMQSVYLYHIATGKRISLGQFHRPKKYSGEWRVDTHPRVSRDGKTVCIDSAHGGKGRQLYLIDISKITANPPRP
ncbi:MAG: hypothetical protein QGG42_05990 [Phycisphaerae bacterium]|jgi:hypothetical protein|nr:hypothetical protein [Phycisphaerae bacterium]